VPVVDSCVHIYALLVGLEIVLRKKSLRCSFRFKTLRGSTGLEKISFVLLDIWHGV
jgi:hypothetical protein